MNTPTWPFPPYQKGYIAQDPIQRGFFTVGSIGSLEQALVREAIQNALDAHTGAGPVTVRFSIVTVSVADYAPYFQNLPGHLKAVVDGLITLPYLTQDMRFLVVEDFQTTGLEGDFKRDYIEDPEPNQNFYYFWRNIGRTGKGGSTLGRWGLGKTVFPSISTFLTFFGLTCRASDGKRLLMGQSVLKHHTLDKTPYTPYGYFGTFGGDQFALPIMDDTFIEKFCETFQLKRKHEPGFSIVVPAPSPDTTPNRLGVSVILQYFYAILVGTLHTKVGRFPIRPDQLEQAVPEIWSKIQNFTVPDEEQFIQTLKFTQWVINQKHNDFIELNTTDSARAPVWKNYTVDQELMLARERFEADRRVAFRIRMKVNNGTKTEFGWFKVFLERDETLKRPESYFLRNGIRIIDVKGHSLRGIRGMVVADEHPLSTMLGDAENPAHTEWQKDTPTFKKYVHGPTSLQFVKNSLSFLAGKMTDITGKLEKDILKDFFYIEEKPEPDRLPKVSGSNRKKPDQGQTDLSIPPLEQKPQPIVSQKAPKGGIEIYANPNANTLVEQVTVYFAYEVHKGNPFQKYSVFDFDLAHHDIDLREVELLECRENKLRFRVTGERFGVRITGFDEQRDVAIRIRWTERPE